MRFIRRMTGPAVYVLAFASMLAAQATQQRRTPDVVFVPTPYEAVNKMLDLAEVNKNSVVYDLGCGDGRIVVTAAKKFGARGVGIDIDPERIQESRENAKREGVTNRVEFREADLFETDLSPATAVTLYLLPELNLRLRPRLLQQLKPGTPIVSHDFDMGDWKAEKTEYVDGPVRRHTIYRWTVPQRVGGVWQVKPSDGSAAFELQLRQDDYQLSGKLVRGGNEVDLSEVEIVEGSKISFLLENNVRFEGIANGDTIEGKLKGVPRSQTWTATRVRSAAYNGD
ncbi:MAG: cyclopropane-fatty-acyl-phospholipid synthase family protein [Candidatus Korobacteraceae bacterium]